MEPLLALQLGPGREKLNDPSSWDALWAQLERRGWRTEFGPKGNGQQIYYMPPRVLRKPPAKCRADYFDSKTLVVRHLLGAGRVVIDACGEEESDEEPPPAAPKAPKTPKTSKAPKAPQAPKAPKTPKPPKAVGTAAADTAAGREPGRGRRLEPVEVAALPPSKRPQSCRGASSLPPPLASPAAHIEPPRASLSALGEGIGGLGDGADDALDRMMSQLMEDDALDRALSQIIGDQTQNYL